MLLLAAGPLTEVFDIETIKAVRQLLAYSTITLQGKELWRITDKMILLVRAIFVPFEQYFENN